MRLEVEFGEEPLVLTGLMLFFQSLLDNLLGFFSLGWLVQGVWGDNVLERLNVQRVSGWHQVVVVDQLDEWLDLSSLGNLLLVVSSGDLQWASLDTDNDSVWEGVGLGTVIVWSDNDNLLTSESTTGNDSCNVSIGGDKKGPDLKLEMDKKTMRRSSCVESIDKWMEWIGI
ncbi:CIC11C00000003486 [Sungouiella intermedia]|uniref:CIC11C00000003486 n=1 Tax=Sungouiella intermedia TaxID=45354 RepID=A0A1L0D6S9_9ASCO|nr:CIC11C00000003486 [[Candida] intermedia]